MKNYSELETDMLKVSDLINVAVVDNNEFLVPLCDSPPLAVRQIDDDMRAVSGEEIFVRSSVREKLIEASSNIAGKLGEVCLEVVYGYRSLSIQTNLFNEMRNRNQELGVSDEDIIEATHRQIAMPEVAGHPTGGAVDVQIVRQSKPLNFGTDIWKFERKSYTFSPEISEEALENRLLLRAAMIEVGFAPFDGEWWHYSYGDREWAAYYKTNAAFYDQVEFQGNPNDILE